MNNIKLYQLFLIILTFLVSCSNEKFSVEEITTESLSMINKDSMPLTIDIATVFSADYNMTHWKCTKTIIHYENTVDQSNKKITNTRTSEGTLILSPVQPKTVKYIHPDSSDISIPTTYKLYNQHFKQSRYKSSNKETLNDLLFFPDSPQSVTLDFYITIPQGKVNYPVFIKREGNKIHKIWAIEILEPNENPVYIITREFDISNSE